MVKRVSLFLIVILSLVIVSGCAPTTQRVKVDPVLVEMEAKKQREIALEAYYEDYFRLNDVAYRIFTKASPLCGEKITNAIGIHIANKYTFPKDMQEAAMSLFKVSNALKILHVIKGSAAEQAGIKEGDIPIKIEKIGTTPIFLFLMCQISRAELFLTLLMSEKYCYKYAL